MTISTVRFLILMSWTCALAALCPSYAQVYAGSNANGTLELSNFKSTGTPELVVAGQAIDEEDLRQSHVLKNAGFSIPDALTALVEEAAQKHGLDPLLLNAVIRTESEYNSQAVSPKGARGLMQLMPDTGRRFGAKDLLDPKENLNAGAQYLRWLLRLFNGNLELALAGFNAGEQAVIRAGYRVPPYKETRNYIPKVLAYYRMKPSLSKARPVCAAAPLDAQQSYSVAWQMDKQCYTPKS